MVEFRKRRYVRSLVLVTAISCSGVVVHADQPASFQSLISQGWKVETNKSESATENLAVDNAKPVSVVEEEDSHSPELIRTQVPNHQVSGAVVAPAIRVNDRHAAIDAVQSKRLADLIRDEANTIAVPRIATRPGVEMIPPAVSRIAAIEPKVIRSSRNAETVPAVEAVTHPIAAIEPKVSRSSPNIAAQVVVAPAISVKETQAAVDAVAQKQLAELIRGEAHLIVVPDVATAPHTETVPAVEAVTHPIAAIEPKVIRSLPPAETVPAVEAVTHPIAAIEPKVIRSLPPAETVPAVEAVTHPIAAIEPKVIQSLPPTETVPAVEAVSHPIAAIEPKVIQSLPPTETVPAVEAVTHPIAAIEPKVIQSLNDNEMLKCTSCGRNSRGRHPDLRVCYIRLHL